MKAFLQNCLLFSFLFFAGIVSVSAQTDASGAKTKDDPDKLEMPSSFQESIEKRRMEAEEKEFKELIGNSEEVLKLSEDLSKAAEKSSKLTNEETMKLTRLEKLIRKIRGQLGAEDDKVPLEEKKDSQLKGIFNTISDSASKMVAEIKKAGRFSVSVIAIQNSNSILDLIKYIRFSKPQPKT